MALLLYNVVTILVRWCGRWYETARNANVPNVN